MMGKSLLTNYVYSFGLTFFKLLAPFILIPYVYRQISPEEMGVANLVIAMGTYFYIFGDLGTYMYGFREISLLKDENKKSKFITEIFTVRAIVNTIAIILFYCYFKLWYSGTIDVFYFYIFLIQIVGNYFNVEWVFEGNQDFKFISIKTIIVRTIFLGLTFIFVRGKYALSYYLLSLVLFMFINNITTFFFLMKKFQWYIGKKTYIYHLKKLFVIFMMINWAVLYFQLDKTFLGSLGMLEEVSFYAISERITLLGSTVLFSLIMVVTPKLGEELNKNHAKFKILFNKIFGIISLAVVPIAFIILINAEEILFILGGKEYVSAKYLLYMFVFYLIFYVVMESVKTNIILLYRKENLFFYIVFTGGLVNFIIKYWFKDYLNVNQFLLITLSIILSNVLILFFYIQLKLKINLFPLIIKYLIISSPIISLIYIKIDSFLISLILKTILSIIYYITILALLKDVNFLYAKGLIHKKIIN